MRDGSMSKKGLTDSSRVVSANSIPHTMRVFLLKHHTFRTVRRGFTIVELLVVIVVIAVLAAISIVAYNGVQQRTRDSVRVSTLNKLTKAIEMYYIDNGRYPAIQDGSGIEGGCGSLTENWGWCDRMKQLADALAPYMTVDPVSLSSATTGTTYYYYYNSGGNDNYMHYGLMVYLEGGGGQNDGGSSMTAYEVGANPSYCMSTYTGASASWRWSASNTRCQGGN